MPSETDTRLSANLHTADGNYFVPIGEAVYMGEAVDNVEYTDLEGKPVADEEVLVFELVVGAVEDMFEEEEDEGDEE